jgi:hypothetical protein
VAEYDWWKVESGNLERHGWRSHRARSETVQNAGGQGGDDVRDVEWECEVGVSSWREGV